MAADIKIIKRKTQAFGQFDGGKAIEQKLIGFHHYSVRER
jgi:hypothetical protein